MSALTFAAALRKVDARITRDSYVGQSPSQQQCRNCEYGGGGHCKLYALLSAAHPAAFALDPAIAPGGYCKAWTER